MCTLVLEVEHVHILFMSVPILFKCLLSLVFSISRLVDSNFMQVFTF